MQVIQIGACDVMCKACRGGGGGNLAHLCQPSMLKMTSHVGVEGGWHMETEACGTSSIEGECHGFQQGDIECHLGNGEGGKA